MKNAKHLNIKIGKGRLFSEIFVTCDLAMTSGNLELTEDYTNLLLFLQENRIIPIYEKVYGRLVHYQQFINTRSSAYKNFAHDSANVPLSYIQGMPANPDSLYEGIHLYGIQIHQAPEVTLENLFFANKCVGKLIKTNDFQQIFLLSVSGAREGASCGFINTESEFHGLFDTLVKILNPAGFEINDLVRTWIYMPELLDVYKNLNTARTKAFKKYDFNKKKDKISYPASTGIQGQSIFNNAVTLDAVAVKSADTFPVLRPMHSPLQSEAYFYGSDFSRGFVIDWPDYRILHISGTASIDDEGNSVFIDNPEKQIEYTLESVLKLLEQHGADFNDIAHACVYFKNMSYKKLFEQTLQNRGWPKFPCIYLIADVCRDDLLVEIDGVAVMDKGQTGRQ